MEARSAILVFVTLMIVRVLSSSSDVDNGSKTQFVYRAGDPQRCMQRSLNKNVIRYEVLPGGGWDNLRNKHGGQVIYYNYSLCQTTDDGQYLLPDGINTVPLKKSKLETFAELFTHWQNYTSTTSSTVNAEAGFHIEHFGIGGSFSHETGSVRSRQMMDESVTTRVQMRYVRYSAKLQPDTAFNPKFKARLLTIATQIAKNQTNMARYESQLLVRDFGTHVITSVDAGAALVQQDQIKTTYARSYSMDKSKVMASASASFGSVFGIKTGYDHSTSNEMIDQYLGNRTHSETDTIGGSVFQPQNFSLNDWAESVAENLVAVDRAGDPLHFVITPMALPELPSSVVYELIMHVKDAINLYYKHNIYKGCTNADSPNFSFQANVDDGTCQSLSNNYTFGGVYQTCSLSGNIRSNTCADLRQMNPLTGDDSCPPNYEAVMIDKGIKRTPNTVRRCHSCGFLGFSTCCGDYAASQTASYTGFWCVTTGKVPADSGYLFGGLFTSTIGNPLTGGRTCPPYFYALKVSSSLRVCVSDDYELGYRYSVPFAGFFSCRTGNPLKLTSDEEDRHKRSNTDMFVLETFLKSAGPSHWPRGCPTGYSEHMAVVANGCEISYCIKANALSGEGLPTIVRPPFMEIPITGFSDNSSVMISEDGLTWTDVVESRNGFETARHTADSGVETNDGVLSHGAVAAIAIVATIAFMAFVLLVGTKVWKWRRPTSEYLRQQSDYLIPNRHVVYGASDEHSEVQIES
ncbi:Macrophage-expressed gene 1 protein [Mizuhopecten yessoensis]|uniref:Macrophage-expressed gene 1 protein n=1 Tax=Mizuhopecten yessoensis TaxID=6573 RepID=A0A210Q242_MIZYE|nr:Macrophage-expressed gene 1 protein [Mizuhopecten yessoensis]